MLIHLSFDADDTDLVASVLAEILDATVVRPPSPPFDDRYRWVCCWDDRGTIVELGPRGIALAPGDAGEITFVPQPASSADRSAFHALFLTQMPFERIEKIAEREGWKCGLVSNANAFDVFNVWVENRVLIEFAGPEQRAQYLACFGPANREALDGQMRGLEAARTAGVEESK